MVVTRSRLHCVKYKLEFDKQIKEMKLPFGCLVGFSGTVYDNDTNKEYTESSLNGFPDRLTQENFKDAYFTIFRHPISQLSGTPIQFYPALDFTIFRHLIPELTGTF